MKERPILFNGDMVRAILGGWKTQTRRIIKPQPLGYTGRKYIVPDDSPKAWHDSDDFLRFCPYGQPGDRLWVRETIERIAGSEHSMYAADGTFTVADAWPWKRNTLASIHCPWGLSRITLEITSVRVERLQDISEADAQAEGAGTVHFPLVDEERADRDRFRALWNKINGPGSWNANPWVWCVTFRRIST